ncbi:MAG: hypothetical protein ACO37W_09820 [Prochlorotrichaceae cyanobacterium]
MLTKLYFSLAETGNFLGKSCILPAIPLNRPLAALPSESRFEG